MNTASAASDLSFYILLALEVLVLAGGVYALTHAVRQRPDAFSAADKLSKPIWLGILVASVLVALGMVLAGLPMMLGIIAAAAIGVYLVDVRPRVDEVQRPRW